jgi:hypothetical protein
MNCFDSRDATEVADSAGALPRGYCDFIEFSKCLAKNIDSHERGSYERYPRRFSAANRSLLVGTLA